jgi:enoyl-CoA hydratase
MRENPRKGDVYMGRTIEYEKKGYVSIIRMNNPPLNLGTNAGMRQFDEILTDIENDKNVRAVVLCAAGKVFAAGSEMHEMEVHLNQGTYVDVKMSEEVRMRVRLSYLPVPTIAALDGSAYGAGFDWALSCDMRVAAPNIVLKLPEVTLGSFPGTGDTYRLTRIIGAGRTLEFMLLAEEMSAKQAKEWGIVNAIAEKGTAFDLAMEWANKIASMSPVATRTIKEAVAAVYKPEQPYLNEVQMELSRKIANSGHLIEGIHAFLEKREPKFD